ncbi:MAG: PP2C family protein-serine/threonine phosphatase [Candidatus Acidiferrales bacterium]
MKALGDVLGFSELEQVEACLAQKLLLPREPLVAPSFAISYMVRTFRDVGGDFLDYFYLGDRRLGIYLGDVVGKGLAAAMFAGLAIGTLRSVHKTGVGPAAVLAAFNKYMRVRPDPFRFCATQYAVFDPQTRELSVANAGIPLPLHISAKGCHPLGEGGIPSGIFDFSKYEEHNFQLSTGDAVLFTTDGLPEAKDINGQDFGMERLIGACAEVGCSSPDRLLRNVFTRVKDFASAAQQDDMSAVVLKLR